MGRSSNHPLPASKLLLCVALASCSSEPDAFEGCYDCINLFASSPLYSAYDGLREYSLTPQIPAAAPNSLNSDPVLASSLHWDVDPSFVALDEFSDLPGAIKLTTKRVGTGSIKVTGTTVSGIQLRGQTKLIVGEALDRQWSAGNERYNSGVSVTWSGLPVAPEGEGTCGLPLTIAFADGAACVSCHDGSNNNLSAEYTPTQTAMYSDSQLLDIVMNGRKPAGETFYSPFLRAVPMPDCVFAAFHTWDLSAYEQKGIVWKLRSIPPKAGP